MKRIFIILAVVVVVLGALVLFVGKALAIEANGGSRITSGLVVASGGEVIEMVFAVPDTLGQPRPSGFTMFSNDATEFWIQRRFAGGLRDTVPLHIPAGRSILIPAPDPVRDSDGANDRITIFVGGHTDSVYAVPWYR